MDVSGIVGDVVSMQSRADRTYWESKLTGNKVSLRIHQHSYLFWSHRFTGRIKDESYRVREDDSLSTARGINVLLGAEHAGTSIVASRRSGDARYAVIARARLRPLLYHRERV